MHCSVCVNEYSVCAADSFSRMCDCVYVCTCACLFVCACVQDASGCLWYFTFPFRQRVSRLAPNEPITGSSIWRVLYGSLGSTISTDESWERSGEWVGQLGERIHRYASTSTHKAVPWLHDLFGMACTKTEDAKSQSCRVWEFLIFHLMSLWNSYKSMADDSQMCHSV